MVGYHYHVDCIVNFITLLTISGVLLILLILIIVLVCMVACLCCIVTCRQNSKGERKTERKKKVENYKNIIAGVNESATTSDGIELKENSAYAQSSIMLTV